MTKEFLTFILTISIAGMANAMIFTSANDADKIMITTGRGVYSIHRTHVNWDEARRRCVSQNSTLAEIMTINELQDLQIELKYIRDLDSAWVGGRGAQPGEDPCTFFWNTKGDDIMLPVNEIHGKCVPTSPRHFLRVEIIENAPLKARHSSSILPYLCKF